MALESVKECFTTALKDENKDRKHKGLLRVKHDLKEAEEYVIKAKKNLELCKFYKEKEGKSDVDEREKSRYSSSVQIKEVAQNYDKMADICKKAISQCEEIIFLDKLLEIPKELLE